LSGHSDADAPVHAIMDALLSAAGLRDIGTFFPDTDPAYKGIGSILLLQKTAEIIARSGFRPVNVSAVIIAERPKLSPFIPAMRENIARALGIPAANVGISATTTEGMGFTGSGAGIAASAACLLAANE
jgi:2-C-methyl-D-erythritol 2,4-cyclodiphosphate synthase